MNYTYLLRCADGSLYAGWTNDLERRLRAHNDGSGAKYTRAHRPVFLAYAEAFAAKEEAQKRECQFKKMKRQERLSLIRAGQDNAVITALIEAVNAGELE